MCQFCVEHGEGKRWYLEAQNYAFDLESDLARRGYIVDFIQGFDDMRATAITAGNVLEKLPSPLARIGKNAITAHQRKNHFGQPLSLEDCEAVFDVATSITAIPCICRMHERGKGADEVCLLVTSQPVHSVLTEGFADYADGPGLDDFHTLTTEETILPKAPPMMMPIAMSTTFPFMANSLNSLSMFTLAGRGVRDVRN